MKLSEALKELGHPVAYYPMLARVFGMQESLFIAQFVYWTGKQNDPDGWIYKSADEIEEETGLTYEQQLRCRRVLGSMDRYGVRGKRVRHVHFEQIIEERYERTEHKMYFRVNLEALDRAFSESLFSGLQSGAVGYYPHTQLGNTHMRSWVIPKSSIQRLLSFNTKTKESREAHKEFVKFWDNMVTKIRGDAKNIFDPAGFRNLKLALKVTDESTLERLGIYFLADVKFQKYGPMLKTFLSSGIMKGLRDAQNKEGFSKRLDDYVDKYRVRRIGGAKIDEYEAILKALTDKLTIKRQ